MRRMLSTFVATVCLLALFISSAACLALPAPQAMAAHAPMAMHTVGSPDHSCCPTTHHDAPHTSISCCTLHHQPAAATSATDVHPSLEITAASLPVTLLAGAAVAPPCDGKTGPPLRRPTTKLRI